jgi:hypothetical protein
MLQTINDRLNLVGGRITRVTGTMWVAIGFAVLSFAALPDVIKSHSVLLFIQWITQSFLQLVLLPIIIVGQNVQGQKTEARDIETHDTVMQAHAETQAILTELHTYVTKGS